MTYLVLARKYRPQNFDDVVGQEHITLTLQNAIRQGRIAHAFLFTGTRGVGKTTIARILAKTLNCTSEHIDNPCNTCTNCKEITEGYSPDVLEIDGASNRGIDEIRNLQEKIRYSPLKSKYKIYIIDEVHMLTNEAFNALLKTLEEPPAHVIFMFATTEVNKIPATILSRCQRYDLRKISQNVIVDRLKKILNIENYLYDEDALHLIARKGNGSLRDTLSLLDQILAISSEKIETNIINNILGIIDYEELFNLFQHILNKDLNNVLVTYAEIVKKYDISEFLNEFITLIENVILILIDNRQKNFLDLSQKLKEDYESFIAKNNIKLSYLWKVIHILLDIQDKLKYSVNKKIRLELGLIEITKLDSIYSIEDIIQMISNDNLNITQINNEKLESFQNINYSYNSETISINNQIKKEENIDIETKNNNLQTKKVKNEKKIDSEINPLSDNNINWHKVMTETAKEEKFLYSILCQATVQFIDNNIEISLDNDTFSLINDFEDKKNFIDKTIKTHFGDNYNFILKKKEINNFEENKDNSIKKNEKKRITQEDYENSIVESLEDCIKNDPDLGKLKKLLGLELELN